MISGCGRKDERDGRPHEYHSAPVSTEVSGAASRAASYDIHMLLSLLSQLLPPLTWRGAGSAKQAPARRRPRPQRAWQTLLVTFLTVYSPTDAALIPTWQNIFCLAQIFVPLSRGRGVFGGQHRRSACCLARRQDTARWQHAADRRPARPTRPAAARRGVAGRVGRPLPRPMPQSPLGVDRGGVFVLPPPRPAAP